MNEKELLKAANGGNVSAIADYADYLVQNKKYVDSQEWFLRGANAGSYYCMHKYVNLTIAMVEASINIMPDEAFNEISNLMEAEKWAKIVRDAGESRDVNLLAGTHGVYSEMVWCYYIMAHKTNEKEYFEAVLEKYNLIEEKPSSRTIYACIQALEEFGEDKKAFDLTVSLVSDYDDTLKDYMLAVLHLTLSEAYFKGKYVKADYNLAYENAKLAEKYNPDNGMLDYFNSGAAKRDFDAAHSQRSSNSSSGSNGCYVATAVYGSYDCPEVWTLRRYRDEVLASSWYGRAFVRIYYAVSPTLVKWFGHTEWFKKLWKEKLDYMVESLKGKGFDDTPYDDKLW